MAPRSSVVTLLFLLLTTVSSRALQPEGPTANECRDHIDAAIKNFLLGQQEKDTSDAIPTAEIYTRAQSDQDFEAADHDGDGSDDDDVQTTLDDHQETEDDETTTDTPETDHIKHDEKREVDTNDDDDDDDKKEEGSEEEEEDEERGHAEVTEQDEDDDDDEHEHTKKAAEHDEEDHEEQEKAEHAKAAADDDDQDEEEHGHAKKVHGHDHEDDDDDDDEEEEDKRTKRDAVQEDDDDDDDETEDQKKDQEDDEEREGAAVEEDEEREGAAVEEKAEEGQEEEEHEAEDVEDQIQAPPTESDHFQRAEKASEEDDDQDRDREEEDDRGIPEAEAAEEDEDQDQEAEDRVERAAEEDDADADEAPTEANQDDDESDKPEEQSPDGVAAPASEAEDDDQPAADQPEHDAEGDDEEHADVPHEPTEETQEEEEEEGKEEDKAEGGDKEEGDSGEEGAEEEEEVIVAGPGQLRTRQNIETILGLGEDSAEDNKEREKIGSEILKEVKRMYEGAVRPLEQLYKFKDISTRQLGDAEIFSRPMVLFLGPWSTGKSAIINYLLGTEYSRYALKTGAEPTSNSFNVIMHGDSDQVLDGTQLAADWAFSTLQKFGQSFLDRLRGRRMSNPLLQKMTIVDSPGILENRKSTERQYPFNDAFQWFIDRADLIYIVFDPTKLDIGMELEAIFDQLKGRENQVRILLNKADTVKPQELMKVQGTLLWNLSPLLGTSEAPTVFVGSFWSRPYLPGSPETLLDAQEEAFLEDLHDALDNRVENKVALSRRHAVRVRNHAKMVDCYLNTYYNHKSFFSNKRKVADDIVENPQNYHIYEGLSILTNVSRYDLPDPDIYREFFRVHPLFDFKPLASTCSYFKGCPLDKLDIAIAYDLPELVGKYQRLMGNRAVVGGR